MKSLLLTTALVAVFGSAALAQTADTGPFRTDITEDMVTASDFIGARVYAAESEINANEYAGVQNDWNDIGEINDIVLSRDGTVSAVLVDIGGFLGMGERQVAIDMAALRFVSDSATADNANDWFLVLNADRATFENAPEYSRGAMNGAAATDGAMATDGAAATTDGTMATDGTAAATTEGTMATDGTAATTEGTMATDGTAATTDGTMANDGTAVQREAMTREGYDNIPAVEMTSEMLTGATVYDAGTDASVGSVADLVIAEDGKIDAVVVDVGGFLGIGAKPVSLPLEQVDILRNADGSDLRLYVNMSKDELQTLPDYNG